MLSLLLFVLFFNNVSSNVFTVTHNNLRSMTANGNTYGQPSAVSMPNLLWDDGLALTAQEYANDCYWGHNSNRKSDLYNNRDKCQFDYNGNDAVGENLYMTTSSTQVNNISYGEQYAVETWYNEYPDYDYDTNTCADNKSCGHYTQVVWANTLYFGCGSVICDNIVNKEDFVNALLIVCDYYSAGNYNGQWPYVSAD